VTEPTNDQPIFHGVARSLRLFHTLQTPPRWVQVELEEIDTAVPRSLG